MNFMKRYPAEILSFLLSVAMLVGGWLAAHTQGPCYINENVGVFGIFFVTPWMLFFAGTTARRIWLLARHPAGHPRFDLICLFGFAGFQLYVYLVFFHWPDLLCFG